MRSRYPISRVFDYAIANYPITTFPDYAITRLRDYPITRLPDYPITQLPDYPISQFPNFPARLGFSVAHGREKVGVCLGLGHLRQQQLHRFDWRERCQHLAQHPDPIEVLLRQQQLLLAGPALLDV